MPIELRDIRSGYNLAEINNNFKTIQRLWDEKLDRLSSSQGNQMSVDLDMDGKAILNVLSTDNPRSLVNKGYVDSANAVQDDRLEVLEHSLDFCSGAPSGYIVNVRDYGAVCNGVFDDTLSIRLAHTVANLSNKKVSYSGIKKIAIKANANIPVNTSVDFCGAEFFIIGGINTPPSYSTFNTLFNIENPETPLVTVEGTSAGDLTQGSITPTKGLFDGYGFAVLEVPFQIPNRAGTGTVNYEQSFCVVRAGTCTLPLSTDLTAFQSQCKVTYRKTSPQIDIHGFYIKEEGWNNQILFSVNRCNVNIYGVTINHENGAAYDNIHQLIHVNHASNVHILDYQAFGQNVSQTIGSYVLEVDYGADIRIERMHSTWFGWSSTGTNHVNGLYFSDSTITRVDAHAGGHNVFVDNCVLQDRAIGIGWGGGQVKVTNSSALRTPIVTNRPDYGGTFFGDILIDNIDLEYNITPELIVVDIEAGASVDTYLPSSIIVRNIHRRGRTSGGGTQGNLSIRVRRRDGSLGKVFAPDLIECSNWTSTNTWFFEALLELASMEQSFNSFRTELVFRNMDCNRVPNINNGVLVPIKTNSPAKPVTLYVKADSVDMLLLEFDQATEVIRQVEVNNSLVSGVIVNKAISPQPFISLSNCEFRFPAVGYSGNTPIGGVYTNIDRMTIIKNCLVHAATFDLSGVSSSQGTLFLKGNTTPLIPSTETFETLFSGFKTGFR